MTALPTTTDPIDIPSGATIRRPDPDRPYVAMSNRKRWSKCALSAVLPQLKTPSGPKAEEGTEAHRPAEWALQAQFAGQPAPAFDLATLNPPAGLDDFDYSPSAIADWRTFVMDCATQYATHAASLVSDCASPTSCLTEYKIEDVVIHGVRVYTVGDVLLWNQDAARLIVGDYKFGRGPVGVGTLQEPNEQCAGTAVLRERQRMALGAQRPAQQIGLFVYQPRIGYGDAWQVLAPMGPDWLAKQGRKLDAELAAVAHAASELGAGRLVDPTPGDHCAYCPSARWCPAAAAYGKAALDVETGRRAVVDLWPDEVMALWASRKAFDEFTDDLRERVRILYEQKHPAVQIKRRTGNKVWKNEPAAVEALMLADRYDLLRPAALGQMEGVLSERDLAALTTRAPDVLTYVATDGKNPTAASSAFAHYLKDKA